tara:strand:- start:3978 stop:4412 length:435 start_codon:yes stop_codon:yes gene_type:complete
MKKCFKCKIKKPLSKFYWHPETKDKYLNKCIVCTKKDVKKRYYKKRKQILEYEKRRTQTKERKLQLRRYKRKSNLKFPGKQKARMKVNRYLRSGKLIKGACETCGDKEVEAHHPDYRKPLDVIWLCKKHHLQQHINYKENNPFK